MRESSVTICTKQKHLPLSSLKFLEVGIVCLWVSQDPWKVLWWGEKEKISCLSFAEFKIKLEFSQVLDIIPFVLGGKKKWHFTFQSLNSPSSLKHVQAKLPGFHFSWKNPRAARPAVFYINKSLHLANGTSWVPQGTHGLVKQLQLIIMLISRAVPVWNLVFWQQPCEVAESPYWAYCCYSSLTSQQNWNTRGKAFALPSTVLGGETHATSQCKCWVRTSFPLFPPIPSTSRSSLRG